MREKSSFSDAYFEGLRGFAEGTTNIWHSYPAYGIAPALNVSLVEIQPQPTTVLPLAAGTLSVVSDSPDDVFGGPGLQAVLAEGLDGGYGNGSSDPSRPYQESALLMNGVTPVDAPASFLRLNTFRGLLGKAVGTVTASIGLEDQLVLRPAETVAKSVRFVVPENWTGYTDVFVLNWSAAQSVQLSCAVTGPDGDVEAEIETQVPSTTQSLPFEGISYRSTTDGRCFAKRVGGGGTDNFVLIIPLTLRRRPN